MSIHRKLKKESMGYACILVSAATAIALAGVLSCSSGGSNDDGAPDTMGEDARAESIISKELPFQDLQGDVLDEGTKDKDGVLEIPDNPDAGDLFGELNDNGQTKDQGQETGPLSGKVKVVPYQIDFGFVPGGQEGKVPFAVHNVGTGALILEKFSLSGSPEISLIVGFDPKVLVDEIVYEIQPQVLLKAGAKFDGFAKFVALQSDEVYAEMRVFTSDGEYPDGLQVHIVGNKVMPAIQFSPPVLDFGPVVVDETAEMEVLLDSAGDLPLSIFDVKLPTAAVQAGFSLDFSSFPGGVVPEVNSPLVLEPADDVELKVVYSPIVPNPKGADGIPIPGDFDLEVKANTFSQSEFLGLSGFAVDDDCAMPIVTVTEGMEIPVGTLLHLSGTSSYSPYGEIVEYKWSMSQPEGNGGFLIPNDAVAEPTFLVGVPGEYQFGLVVDDEMGKGTCQETTKTVSATASEVATFTMTWKSVDPIIPEPPFMGQDLDLHFLHPNAAGVDADKDGKPDGYYHLPWDCFWYNAYPNWDNKQPTAWYDDDARLLFDNQDGNGPEVVVMGLKCIPGNDYRFGVHFFDDHGYGPVEATIQAHVSGSMVWQGKATLSDLDLWKAGVFHCGTNTVEGIPGPVIKHDYENPSFVIPP